MIEFQGWPKTPRLSNGGVTITEKIDGTNACVVVFPVPLGQAGTLPTPETLGGFCWVYDAQREDVAYLVGAQSRKRLIFPGQDNAGFAGWVQSYAVELFDLLGPGRHFGEWWGQGIQRRYGMNRKVFSLFNTHRWHKIAEQRGDWEKHAESLGMTTVPTMYEGRLSDYQIENCLNILRENGSFAASQWGFPGQKAEGIIIRHRDLGGNLKAFVENDDTPKSVSEKVKEAIQRLES